MNYFLDTNICIYFLKGTYDSLRSKLLSKNPGTIKIPSIVKAELLYGAEKSSNVKSNVEIIHEFLFPFEIVPFSDSDTTHYSLIRSTLEASGNIIGPNDLLIASIVLGNDGVLVTNNEKEFKRIQNLKLENWTT